MRNGVKTALILFMIVGSISVWGKDHETAADRILKRQTESPNLQNRMKRWEKEVNVLEAVRDYERKKTEYQETLENLVKIRGENESLLAELRAAFEAWSKNTSSTKTWRYLQALERKVAQGSEQQNRLHDLAEQLWKEKQKSFFAALQTKKNAYALEMKHQMTEVARRATKDVPIPKPQD
ncbi:MAG: hypothetical protein HY466_07335 [Deltaproteobacteria bacterium]|nr:hypothetical protein [Deltaproteobacteria bacterium]